MIPDAQDLNLHGLTYISRARPETIADMDVAVSRILKDAQARNVAFHVTGALLACDGWFLQSLEGSRVRVVEAFGRIRNDRRHDSIRVIADGPIQERKFGEWSMCGRRLSSTDDAILSVLENPGAFDPARLTLTRASALLQNVQKLQKSSEASEALYL
jgi:Sensors of blue-light using FAD